MVRKYKKAFVNALFLFGLIAITIFFTFKDRNEKEIFTYIQAANDWWLLPALALVLIFICGESVIMKYLYGRLGVKISIFQCIKYSFIGFFFSGVTPSATGGQPMQLFYMGKDKLSVSKSCLVLLIITIGYKAALIVMSGVLFIFQGGFISDNLDSVIIILIYGIIVNILFIVFLFILIFKAELTEKIISGLGKLLHRIHIVKDIEGFCDKLKTQMEHYRDGAEYLKKNKRVFVYVLLLSIAQRTALFLVTWCVYKSFGLKGISVVQIVALQTIISLSVDMLPLPGGVGASEKSFAIMFDTIFGMELVIPGMLLSRGISFYFLIIITGIVTVIVHSKMVILEHKKVGRDLE